MPMLMDMSNVMVSTLMAQLGNHKNAEVDEGMLRHMVLNSIRTNYKKFTGEYGELIICADNKNYWRKDAFPYYKGLRKEHREQSELDWKAIFEALNKIKAEIVEFLPYKVVEVEHAEADDIIAVICGLYGRDLGGEPVLVISGDKDMTQLQKFSNVTQWDPVRKRWLRNSQPEKNLFEHIVRGDRGDGIPSIRGKDDSIMIRERAKPITAKMLDQWFANPDSMSSEEKRNFERNKLLIDFDQIPQSIRTAIVEKYNSMPNKDRSKLFDYFINHRLRNLMDAISDF